MLRLSLENKICQTLKVSVGSSGTSHLVFGRPLLARSLVLPGDDGRLKTSHNLDLGALRIQEPENCFEEHSVLWGKGISLEGYLRIHGLDLAFIEGLTEDLQTTLILEVE